MAARGLCMPLHIPTESVSWKTISIHIDLNNFDLRGKNVTFAKYLSSHLVFLLKEMLHIDDTQSTMNLASCLDSVRLIGGWDEKTYRLTFSDYEILNDVLNTDFEELSILLQTRGTTSITLKSVQRNTHERSRKMFSIDGANRRSKPQDTFGGYIFAVLNDTSVWDTVSVMLENDEYCCLPRILWSIPFEGNWSNIKDSNAPWHAVLGVQETSPHDDRLKARNILSRRVHPDKIRTNFPFLDDASEEEVIHFNLTCTEIQQNINTAWETACGGEAPGPPPKRSKTEDEGYDWEAYPLTSTCVGEFKLQQARMLVIAQTMMEDWISRHLICDAQGDLREFQYVNGVKYSTPDIHKPCVTLEDLSTSFKYHVRHILLRRKQTKCIFCKFGAWRDLETFQETPMFFDHLSQSLSKTRARNSFADVNIHLNEDKTLDYDMIAFSNGYVTIVPYRFHTLEEIHNGDVIAMCNHTQYTLDEQYTTREFENNFLKDNVFLDILEKCQVFGSLFSMPTNFIKVLLALIGAGFTKRGKHDSYQFLTFIVGQANMGKSELLKIIRILYNDHLCFTPDLQTWGRAFATGQFAEGHHKAILADEMPRTNRVAGITPTTLCTYADQTKMRFEVKHQQKLKEKEFSLAIFWCCNQFFQDWEVSDALLRRIVCFDLAFFDFSELPEPPSAIVARTEAPHLVILMIHCYELMLRTSTTNVWAYIFKEAKELTTIHSTVLAPTDKIYVSLLRFFAHECRYGKKHSCTRQQFNTKAIAFISRDTDENVNSNVLDIKSEPRIGQRGYKSVVDIILKRRCMVSISNDKDFKGIGLYDRTAPTRQRMTVASMLQNVN